MPTWALTGITGLCDVKGAWRPAWVLIHWQALKVAIHPFCWTMGNDSTRQMRTGLTSFWGMLASNCQESFIVQLELISEYFLRCNNFLLRTKCPNTEMVKWTQDLTPNQETLCNWYSLDFGSQWSITGYINHTPFRSGPIPRNTWLTQN